MPGQLKHWLLHSVFLLCLSAGFGQNLTEEATLFNDHVFADTSFDYAAQSFIANSDTLSRFEVILQLNDTVGEVVLMICEEANDGSPNVNAPLFSGTKHVTSMVATAFGEFPKLPVLKTKKYFVVVSQAPGSGTVGKTSVGESYYFTDTREPMIFSSDNGTSWDSVETGRMALRVEGSGCIGTSLNIDYPGTAIEACLGDTIELEAEPWSGSYFWSWTGDTTETTTFVATIPTPQFLYGVDPLGCLSRDSLELLVNSPPLLEIPDTIEACFGEVVSIVPDLVLPDYGYLWSTGATDPILEIDSSGLYWLEVEDNIGCKNQDSSIAIFFLEEPVRIGLDTSFCFGGTMSLETELEYPSYIWSTGSTNRLINVSTTGEYFVSVYDNNGCSRFSDTIIVTIFPLPSVPVISASQGVLSTGSGFAYQWYKGGLPIQEAKSSSYVPEGPGGYVVQVIDSNGCTANSETFFVEEKIRKEDIPEAFSPNGDQLNDYFYVNGLQFVDGVGLKVVNRWGDVVFESTSYRNDWDGDGKNGLHLPEGVYYYELSVPGQGLLSGPVYIKRQ